MAFPPAFRLFCFSLFLIFSLLLFFYYKKSLFRSSIYTQKGMKIGKKDFEFFSQEKVSYKHGFAFTISWGRQQVNAHDTDSYNLLNPPCMYSHCIQIFILFLTSLQTFFLVIAFSASLVSFSMLKTLHPHHFVLHKVPVLASTNSFTLTAT